jgi:hypothetical protein
MKGTEKSQIYEALYELIHGHLGAHRMAQWNNDGVVDKISELLIKRIYREFDVSYKRPDESQEINEFGDDDWATPQD